MCCGLLLTGCSGSLLTGQVQPTGSGAVLQALSLLPPVPQGADLEQDLRAMEEMFAARHTYDDRIRDARSRCDEELRRANKDAKWAVTLDCLRAQYQLEATGLGGLVSRLQTLQKTSPSPAAKNASASAAALQQALVAIVHGIENGVYEDEQLALETKERLGTQYREPLWQDMVALLTERLGWQLRRVMESLHATAPDDPLLPCLATCAEEWKQIPDTGLEGSQTALELLHKKMLACLDAPREPASATGTTAAP